jgi:hypothetical protein
MPLNNSTILLLHSYRQVYYIGPGMRFRVVRGRNPCTYSCMQLQTVRGLLSHFAV